jgi:Ni,Fe-hydrogenase maturation factor
MTLSPFFYYMVIEKLQTIAAEHGLPGIFKNLQPGDIARLCYKQPTPAHQMTWREALSDDD